MEELIQEQQHEEELLRQLAGVQDLEEAKSLEIEVDTTTASVNNIGRRMPKLQELKLNGSVLESIRDLGSGLRNLQVLWVARCGLQGLEGIGGVPLLRELYASFNSIDNLEPLTGLEQLEVVDLEGNALEDIGNLAYLAWCPRLTALTLAGNPLADEPTYTGQVAAALPQLLTVDDMELRPASSASTAQHAQAARESSTHQMPSSLSPANSGLAIQGPMSSARLPPQAPTGAAKQAAMPSIPAVSGTGSMAGAPSGTFQPPPALPQRPGSARMRAPGGVGMRPDTAWGCRPATAVGSRPQSAGSRPSTAGSVPSAGLPLTGASISGLFWRKNHVKDTPNPIILNLDLERRRLSEGAESDISSGSEASTAEDSEQSMGSAGSRHSGLATTRGVLLDMPTPAPGNLVVSDRVQQALQRHASTAASTAAEEVLTSDDQVAAQDRPEEAVAEPAYSSSSSFSNDVHAQAAIAGHQAPPEPASQRNERTSLPETQRRDAAVAGPMRPALDVAHSAHLTADTSVSYSPGQSSLLPTTQPVSIGISGLLESTSNSTERLQREMSKDWRLWRRTSSSGGSLEGRSSSADGSATSEGTPAFGTEAHPRRAPAGWLGKLQQWGQGRREQRKARQSPAPPPHMLTAPSLTLSQHSPGPKPGAEAPPHVPLSSLIRSSSLAAAAAAQSAEALEAARAREQQRASMSSLPSTPFYSPMNRSAAQRATTSPPGTPPFYPATDRSSPSPRMQRLLSGGLAGSATGASSRPLSPSLQPLLPLLPGRHASPAGSSITLPRIGPATPRLLPSSSSMSPPQSPMQELQGRSMSRQLSGLSAQHSADASLAGFPARPASPAQRPRSASASGLPSPPASAMFANRTSTGAPTNRPASPAGKWQPESAGYSLTAAASLSGGRRDRELRDGAAEILVVDGSR